MQTGYESSWKSHPDPILWPLKQWYAILCTPTQQVPGISSRGKGDTSARLPGIQAARIHARPAALR